ncbi:hypothetical protein [Enterobacter ludwigii]|uniref:hypothetical protein n=1 Tax=Enterobacter ludwigii TaxID=299767 RepID=UPI003D17790D
MAAVCLDTNSILRLTVSDSEIFEAFPKIENRIGDTPYTPDKATVMFISTQASQPDKCLGLAALSVIMICLIGVIVNVLGGKVMRYIPLYIALLPVLYWMLKIGYAFFVVKFHKLQASSAYFKQED